MANLSRNLFLFLTVFVAVSALPERHVTASSQSASSQSASSQSASSQPAAQDQDFWGDSWKCGRLVPLTQELLQAIDFDDPYRPVVGYSGGGKLPPFLIGVFKPVWYGAVLFVNQNGVWHAYPLQQGGDPFGIYVSPDHASAVIFAMWTVEGPGQEYTVLSTNNAFRSRSCALVPRPASLYIAGRSLDYMVIEDFNANLAGNATLIGSIDFADDEKKPGPIRWYRASAPRLGAKWRTPHRIAAKPKPLPGIYKQVEHQDLQSLIDSLRASAGRQ
jgi:hypothetical protein